MPWSLDVFLGVMVQEAGTTIDPLRLIRRINHKITRSRGIAARHATQSDRMIHILKLIESCKFPERSAEFRIDSAALVKVAQGFLRGMVL